MLRVLVVDDRADLAESLGLLLRVLHCEAVVALNGASAVRLAAQQCPDLVLLDLDLAGENGCNVLQDMRVGLRGAPWPLMVCLTGHCDRASEQTCRRAGFDLFLMKPLDLTLLQQVLDLCRARRRPAAPAIPKVNVGPIAVAFTAPGAPTVQA